jgi:hypothetical protein
MNCSRGAPFRHAPFHHLCTGQFPAATQPTPAQITRELTTAATGAGTKDLARLIRSAYPQKTFDDAVSNSARARTDQTRAAWANCRALLTALLRKHEEIRQKLAQGPRFYKLPRFVVLELLVDDPLGLHGFRMHFSNGSSAVFARYSDSTVCQNLILGSDGVTPYAGDLSQLRDEWRVGEKRLYEVGLPGRYNELGEWRPLAYPRGSKSLEVEARALSDDPAVQGAIFYALCTGHRVIEFVVVTDVDLPMNGVTLGSRLHLWKCPPREGAIFPQIEERVYDGWFDLEQISPEYIRSALTAIGVGLNRLAFAYDAQLRWRPKYSLDTPVRSTAMPTEEDLPMLDRMLRDFPTTNDAIILDAAVDWYNRATATRNVFTMFLSYYIATESVAIAVADGDAQLGLGHVAASKQEEKQRKLACVRQMHDKLYVEDPVKFVCEAYFECVVGLKQKTRRVAEMLFGPDHAHMRSLFVKGRDGCSLHDIRSKLAHGKLTLVDPEHEALVRSRVGEIAQVSREFLLRAIFGLKPGDPLPAWSGQHAAGALASDPRTTLVVEPDVPWALGERDWRIQPDWCD